MADANPFDQFDSAAPAGANPFDQFDAKAAPAQATQPKVESYISNVGKAIDAAVTGGQADLLHSYMPNAPSLSDLKSQTAAAQQSLPWYESLPIDVGGYMAGPGKIFGPVGEGISGAAGAALPGALGRAAGSAAGKTAAEFGLAGGLSNFDPNDPVSSTLWGMGTGAGIGAATHGVGAGIGKLLSKPGVVDPAAAIAQTKAAEDAVYNAMKQKPIDPGHVGRAITGVMTNLDPSVETGMSGGLRSQIGDIQEALQNQWIQKQPVDANQVNSWQRQINEAASRNRFPTDAIVAGKISSGLDNVLAANGAGDLNAAAKTASQQRIMAEKLGEWQQGLNAFEKAPGGEPQTQAAYYKPGSAQYQSLQDIVAAEAAMTDPSYSAAHAGREIGGAIGYGVGGFPGHIVGAAGGYYLGKVGGRGVTSSIKHRGLRRALQSAYPQLTGVPLTGARQADPAIGDAIKKLMLGTMY